MSKKAAIYAAGALGFLIAANILGSPTHTATSDTCVLEGIFMAILAVGEDL